MTALKRYEGIWAQELKYSVYCGNRRSVIFIFKTQNSPVPYPPKGIITVTVTMKTQVSQSPDSTCYYRTMVLHEIISYYLIYFWPSPAKAHNSVNSHSLYHLSHHTRALKGPRLKEQMTLTYPSERPTQRSQEAATLLPFCFLVF